VSGKTVLSIARLKEQIALDNQRIAIYSWSRPSPFLWRALRAMPGCVPVNDHELHFPNGSVVTFLFGEDSAEELMGNYPCLFKDNR
jgi:hypothetical protein